MRWGYEKAKDVGHFVDKLVNRLEMSEDVGMDVNMIKSKRERGRTKSRENTET